MGLSRGEFPAPTCLSFFNGSPKPWASPRQRLPQNLFHELCEVRLFTGARHCNVDRGNLIFGQKIPQTLSDIRVAGVDVGTACCLAVEIPLKTIIQIRFKVAVVKLE
jgi:hypothetical protein